MAIPCAVYKVFPNTEGEKNSVATRVLMFHARPMLDYEREKKFNETSAFTTLIKSRKKRP